MYVPPDKLDSVLVMCNRWQTKKFCSKRQLQSLLGSLLYVSKCVKPARTFLNCMVMLLRENFNKKNIFLTRDFFNDLNWFHTFLTQFNGVVYYDTKPIQAELHLDASLTGMGGIFDNNCYALPIPKHFQNYSIVHLEMINILVVLKILSYQWKDKKIRIKCDNMAVVEVLTSGKTKDAILGACARNIWILATLLNISIHIEHIDGKLNVIADLRSRFKFDQQSWELLNTYVPNMSCISTHIDFTCLIMVYSFRSHGCFSPVDHQSVCPASGCIFETYDSENIWGYDLLRKCPRTLVEI